MKPRVLIVDDQSETLESLQECVQAISPEWEVEVEKNGYFAKRKLTDAMGNGKPFHVVVTDLTMEEEKSGLGVLKYALKEGAKVIIVTAYGGIIDRYDVFARGAFDVIEKAVPHERAAEHLVAKCRHAVGDFGGDLKPAAGDPRFLFVGSGQRLFDEVQQNFTSNNIRCEFECVQQEDKAVDVLETAAENERWIDVVVVEHYPFEDEKSLSFLQRALAIDPDVKVIFVCPGKGDRPSDEVKAISLLKNQALKQGAYDVISPFGSVRLVMELKYKMLHALNCRRRRRTEEAVEEESRPAARQQTGLRADLDLEFHRLVAQHQQGGLTSLTSSTDQNQISFLCTVADPQRWQELGYVEKGAAIALGGDAGGCLVSGRISLADVARLGDEEFVTSLTASEQVSTQSDVPDDVEMEPQGSFTGKGTIVGIVDVGFDFSNPAFLDDNQQTRILALWDQNGLGSEGSAVAYGREYSREEINAALHAPKPHVALGLPSDPFQHGTRVAKIAAGNKGAAPGADLVVVEIGSTAAPSGAPLCESVELVEAVNYIFEKAKDRPCVVNVSLSRNAGPHDGTSLVERAFDRLAENGANRAIVIVAGNNHAGKMHTCGQVSKDEPVDIVWKISDKNSTASNLQIWYGASDRVAVELLDDEGDQICRLRPNDPPFLSQEIQVHNRLHVGVDNQIKIRLEAQINHDVKIRLHGVKVESDPSYYHAWIERDDACQSTFHDSKTDCTIAAIACGKHTIVVGAYLHEDPFTIAPFSGGGPTRIGELKPDVSAPGTNGTSYAAPLVTGIIARLFEKNVGVNLDVNVVRQQLKELTNPKALSGSNWHCQHGFGAIEAQQVLKEL